MKRLTQDIMGLGWIVFLISLPVDLGGQEPASVHRAGYTDQSYEVRLPAADPGPLDLRVPQFLDLGALGSGAEYRLDDSYAKVPCCYPRNFRLWADRAHTYENVLYGIVISLGNPTAELIASRAKDAAALAGELSANSTVIDAMDRLKPAVTQVNHPTWVYSGALKVLAAFFEASEAADQAEIEVMTQAALSIAVIDYRLAWLVESIRQARDTDPHLLEALSRVERRVESERQQTVGELTTAARRGAFTATYINAGLEAGGGLLISQAVSSLIGAGAVAGVTGVLLPALAFWQVGRSVEALETEAGLALGWDLCSGWSADAGPADPGGADILSACRAVVAELAHRYSEVGDYLATPRSKTINGPTLGELLAQAEAFADGQVAYETGNNLAIGYAGLVAHYDMTLSGDQILDQSGNGRNGTVFGTVPTQDRFGVEGQALSFDGINDYVEITYGTWKEVDAFTLAAWVRTTRGEVLAGEQYLISSHYEQPYSLRTSVHNNGVYGSVIGEGPVDNTNHIVLIGATEADATWRFVVATYDGSNARLYVDGVQEDVEPFSGPLGANTSPVHLGNRSTDNTGPFVGDMDEVWLYGSALTAEEVLQKYEATRPIKFRIEEGALPPDDCEDVLSGLVACYTFDAHYMDATANMLHGSPSGGVGFGLDRFGIPGLALELDGVDDAVIVPHSPLLNLGDSYAISAWVMSDLGDFDNAVVFKGDGLGIPNRPGTHEYLVFMTNVQNWPRGSSGTVYNRVGWDNPTPKTEWTHLVFSVNQGLGRLYVNGELKASEILGPSVPGSSDLTIGGGPSGIGGRPPYYYLGSIDELRIYDRGLEPEDIDELCDVESTCVGTN